MRCKEPGILECGVERRHPRSDDVREVCLRGLESSPGRIDFDIPDLTVHVNGDLAVT
jgi:hypothetical protein